MRPLFCRLMRWLLTDGQSERMRKHAEIAAIRQEMGLHPIERKDWWADA